MSRAKLFHAPAFAVIVATETQTKKTRRRLDSRAIAGMGVLQREVVTFVVNKFVRSFVRPEC